MMEVTTTIVEVAHKMVDVVPKIVGGTTTMIDVSPNAECEFHENGRR